MTIRTDCPAGFPFGVYDTMAAVFTAISPTRLPYAVGGSVAMFAGGYTRNTEDVDIFIVDDVLCNPEIADVEVVLAALRRAGFRVEQVAESHFRAQLPRYFGTPIHADILTCCTAPELAAIAAPTPRQLGRLRFPAFSLNEVAASKLTVDPESLDWPKTQLDLIGLYRYGLIDLAAIRQFFVENDVPYVEEVDELLTELAKPRSNPGYRPRRRREF